MSEIESLKADNTALREKLELIQEDLVRRAIALDDAGWTALNEFSNGGNDDGIPLHLLQKLSPKLRELAASNPWHIRGSQLRHSYVFGGGMRFIDVKPGTQKVLDNPHNKEMIFSTAGYSNANLAKFTDGQYILFKNTKTKQFHTPSIRRVGGVIVNPDDDMDIWYIKRSRVPLTGDPQDEWVPTARHRKNGSIPKSIGSDPVAQDEVAYIHRSKLQTGWTWGVPDSLGAMIWTLAYSAYLKDNSQLVTALARFAWTVTQKTQSGVNAAAAQVRTTGEIGATAVGGLGMELSSVGVPSAQVNMNNGQPLISAVAAAFGVPVIALISSPGATGGSYGAATTLDSPTIKGFEAEQDTWKNFYEEILRDTGSPDATVEFPSIETDAPYRQVTSIVSAVELGLIWPDEGRSAVLDILDVEKKHDNAPPRPEPSGRTVVSSQGNSGAIGATTNPQGDTNHDADNE